MGLGGVALADMLATKHYFGTLRHEHLVEQLPDSDLRPHYAAPVQPAQQLVRGLLE